MDDAGARFSDEDVARLVLVLEQIQGCGELLLSHLDVAHDYGAMTAITVMREKATEATRIVHAGVAAASAIRRAAG